MLLSFIYCKDKMQKSFFFSMRKQYRSQLKTKTKGNKSKIKLIMADGSFILIINRILVKEWRLLYLFVANKQLSQWLSYSAG